MVPREAKNSIKAAKNFFHLSFVSTLCGVCKSLFRSNSYCLAIVEQALNKVCNL